MCGCVQSHLSTTGTFSFTIFTYGVALILLKATVIIGVPSPCHRLSRLISSMDARYSPTELFNGAQRRVFVAERNILHRASTPPQEESRALVDAVSYL